MRSSPVNTGDSVLATQYDALRQDAAGGAMLLVHQQATPGMTLYIEPGVAYVGATRVIYAGGSTPSMTAPVSNPRIDLITIDSTGTIAVTTGTENASPVAPTYPASKLVLAEVYHRVSETALYDTDQGGTTGYISHDVRPVLGGSYIASDAQVDAAANISVSKLNGGAVNSDWIPAATDTQNLGSSSKEWLTLYAKTVYQNGVQIAGGKFGGNGSDGVMSISSGTTNIDCGGANLLIKQYSSLSITGSGALTFSNPHPNGTTIILKVSGNVTLTSTATPMIDASGMGAAGGSGGGAGGGAGVAGNIGNNTQDTLSHKGNGGGGAGSTTGGTAGSGGVAYSNPGVYTTSTFQLSTHSIMLACGSGGGGGGGSTGAYNQAAGGAGGAGGGVLIIECGGALNFTTTNGISVAGKNGSAGANGVGSYGGEGGGGGGGGAGGYCIILYNTLTAATGTINTAGGAGGAGGNAGTSTNGGDTSGAGGGGGGGGAADGGPGGAGAVGAYSAGGANGAAGNVGSGNRAGGGGGGGASSPNSAAIGFSATGGAGGAAGPSQNALIAQNYFF